ncbi:hypothetical protein Tco_0678507 [Tanacetum coccineum]|uniref:Uncharacterized protein n=1 Tax=Tanacetum coccineum TaxID=301880 RepID=A0ABQ4XFA8_9ASTR
MVFKLQRGNTDWLAAQTDERTWMNKSWKHITVLQAKIQDVLIRHKHEFSGIDAEPNWNSETDDSNVTPDQQICVINDIQD